jgi:hypothetical protein
LRIGVYRRIGFVFPFSISIRKATHPVMIIEDFGRFTGTAPGKPGGYTRTIASDQLHSSFITQHSAFLSSSPSFCASAQRLPIYTSRAARIFKTARSARTVTCINQLKSRGGKRGIAVFLRSEALRVSANMALTPDARL